MKISVFKKSTTVLLAIIFALCNVITASATGAPQNTERTIPYSTVQELSSIENNLLNEPETAVVSEEKPDTVGTPVLDRTQAAKMVEELKDMQNTPSSSPVLQSSLEETEVLEQAEPVASSKPDMLNGQAVTEAENNVSAETSPTIPEANATEEALETEEITAEATDTIVYKTDAITLDNIPSYLIEAVGLSSVSAEKAPVDLFDKNKDELYSFTTVNADETHTLYLFNEPIKYIDTAANEIKFIDNTITPKLTLTETVSPLETDVNMSASASVSPEPLVTGYTNTANSFSVNFPLSINQGVSLETAKGKITLSPSIASVSKASLKTATFLGVSEQVVEYRDVFGSGTHLQYIPINNGFKENIVLDSYTGINTFSFLIDTGTYYPLYTEGEAIPFADPTTDEIAFVLSQVDARDSYVGEETDGHFTLYNSLSLTEIKSGKYMLTVTVDNEFLTNDSTVYPVVIDPSLTLPKTIFRDTTVYSGKPNTQTFYSSSYNIVGYHGSSYGTGIAYIQTKKMTDFNYIFPENVISATYKVYEGSGKTNSVNVGLYMTQANWAQDTITYNNRPANGSLVDSNTVNKSGYYTFDITNHIKNTLAWSIEYAGYSQTRGFALIAADSSASSKHFCSGNYTGSTTPSITIEYKAYPEYNVGTLSKYSSTDEIGEKNYAWGKDITCGIYLYKFTVSQQAVLDICTVRTNAVSGNVSDTEITIYDSTYTKIYRTTSLQNTELNMYGIYYAQLAPTLSAGTYYVEVNDIDPAQIGRSCYLIIDCNDFITGYTLKNQTNEYNLAQIVEEFHIIGPMDDNQNCYSYAFEQTQANPDFSQNLPALVNELSALGYTQCSSYQTNCVIVYATDNNGDEDISHFARADDGIVTAKLGPDYYIRQKYVDIYYENSTYGSPIAYFVKS